MQEEVAAGTKMTPTKRRMLLSHTTFTLEGRHWKNGPQSSATHATGSCTTATFTALVVVSEIAASPVPPLLVHRPLRGSICMTVAMSRPSLLLPVSTMLPFHICFLSSSPCIMHTPSTRTPVTFGPERLVEGVGLGSSTLPAVSV